MFRRPDLLTAVFAFLIVFAMYAAVKSVVDLLLNIVSIAGHTEFVRLSFSVGGGVFQYGAVVEALVTLLVTGFVVYWLARRLLPQWLAAPEPYRKCPECHMDIPVAALRCGHCTAQLGR